MDNLWFVFIYIVDCTFLLTNILLLFLESYHHYNNDMTMRDYDDGKLLVFTPPLILEPLHMFSNLHMRFNTFLITVNCL